MSDRTARPRYQVTRLYDDEGNVAAHFVNEEFHMFVDTWEHAMQDPHFASIIDIELRAEPVADAPLGHLAALAPSERVRELFTSWLAFMDEQLEPWTTGGAIHFRPHWARVLMHALVMGEALGLPDADLRALAMAAVFHDTRRKSPYLDTGHGARAAAYYAQACAAQAATGNGGPLSYDPRTMLAIAWHDRDDEAGLRATVHAVEHDEDPVGKGSFAAALPTSASADAPTILRIFKDADGLDRVRLGPGGLDERYLRTAPARANVAFAHELLTATERL